ncbi:MAG TPA: UvrD-helicase domain-containing protein [Negativicutes bacterium]|nr:UvrD-helicase domain-containing protein [Negativicutes bacterium]
MGEYKDDRLKDIVSTIQSEQNEIIRADIESPLVVQGAAGSGKTTIALHRIAYLIYNYEKSFDPNSFMTIAPNRLFLKYISEVLPELGVEQVKQTTFVELTYDLLEVGYKLADPDEKLVRFIKAEEEAEGRLQLLRKVSRLKGSLEFKDMIGRYTEHIKRTFMPEQDFCLEEHILFTAEELRKMLLEDFSNYPLYARLPELKKALSNKLKRDKVRIIRERKDFYDSEIGHLLDAFEPSEERRCKVIAMMEERDKRVDSLKRAAKTAVAKYLEMFPRYDVIDYYRELLTSSDNVRRLAEGLIDEETAGFMCSDTKTFLDQKALEYEGLAPLLYLKLKLFGFSRKLGIRYIVIDEAQDFSLFQLYALKRIFNTELFTIVGDLAQGIHSHRGIGDWKAVVDKIFTHRKCRYLTLEEDFTERELNLKLLYVAMTRALHNLDIICTIGNMSLMDKTGRELFGGYGACL